MKIGVVGCLGRMGKTIAATILDNPNCTLSGGITIPTDPNLGKDLGFLLGRDNLNLPVTDDINSLIKKSDVLIDFTAPNTTLAYAALVSDAGKSYVTGTTGFTDEQFKELQSLGKKSTIIWSSNMSLGVNLLMALTKQVASILDEDFDIEILEMHHHDKIDSPSGTAVSLGKAAAAGRGYDFNEVACKARDGLVGKRPKKEIGFATLRGGDVIGDHSVIFAANGEIIELKHRATTRNIFANGAVKAALWTKGKKAGFYSMQDVLGV